MPIYEYRCTACQHQLEAIQKFSDAPMLVCPKCGKETLTKLLSAAGFHLKGSGWYQTDFRGSGSKPAAKTESDGARSEADGVKSTDSPKAESGTSTDGKAGVAIKPADTAVTPKVDKPSSAGSGSSPAT